MKLGTVIFCVVASTLLLTSQRIAAGDQAPSLSVNPFERPAWINDALAARDSDPSAQRRARIDLRATLVADTESLVNVGGKIVGIGADVQGYVLVSIEEGTAVFRDDDEVIRVSVVGDNKDEDDETE